MKNLLRWSLPLFLALMAVTFSAQAKTEEQLVTDLSSEDPGKVTKALGELETKYPHSVTATPEIKKLLTDSRLKVKRKAARVLGVWKADVSEADIKAICELLSGPTKDEKLDGLKALRGLKAPSAVPQILPLLKDENSNVIRDACRTLAVLGTKENIPAIEPLLQHPNSEVQVDAQEAIASLQNK